MDWLQRHYSILAVGILIREEALLMCLNVVAAVAADGWRTTIFQVRYPTYLGTFQSSWKCKCRRSLCRFDANFESVEVIEMTFISMLI